MALDINGYNATFKSFVKFAQDNFNAGDEKAIASAKIQQPLGGRKIGFFSRPQIEFNLEYKA